VLFDEGGMRVRSSPPNRERLWRSSKMCPDGFCLEKSGRGDSPNGNFREGSLTAAKEKVRDAQGRHGDGIRRNRAKDELGWGRWRNFGLKHNASENR